MNYINDILNRLLDIYERRHAFTKDPSTLRAISIDLKKVYPSYLDRYNHAEYIDINSNIDKLSFEGLIIADKDNKGQYSKVKLNVNKIEECYKRLGRKNIPDKCDSVKKVLDKYDKSKYPLIQAVLHDFNLLIEDFHKLPHGLDFKPGYTDEILHVLTEILKLEEETYIRNFSTAVFKDSKRFQKEFKSVTESILFEYTDCIGEKKDILEYYNLFENPTYVLIKGNASITLSNSLIDLSGIPGGIALPNSSLDFIDNITVKSERVVTVENLTTFHDADEKDCVYIYLGGYHSSAKQKLLKKIYETNSSLGYFHEGDLDVYGFLILENLKEKTGIPFSPLKMDILTLESFFKAGMVKPLTSQDIKVINASINTKLYEYRDVLSFMLENNCKAEQESLKALEIANL